MAKNFGGLGIAEGKQMVKSRRNALCVYGVAALFWFAPTANAGTYLDSGHGGYNTPGNGVSRLPGYAPGNCSHCHEQHASADGVEPAPVGGAPSPYALFDSLANNALCNYCHDISQKNGADNIADQIAKTYSHDPASAIGTVLCTDCHNPHVAQITTHSAAADGNSVGTPAAPKSGPLLEVAGVSAAWSPPATPIGGNENLSNAILTLKDPITAEYELCFKCHGGQIGGLTNLTGQFNPDNYAHHPVTGTGQWSNATIRANYTTLLKPPWNANLDARMYCSDCHASETAGDPAGPHGSNNAYMLKAIGPGSSYDNLCLSCHADAYNGGAAGFPSPWSHGSNGAHQYEGEAAGQNKLGCLACHGGPAGMADFTVVTGVSANGGRVAAIHGENFMWQYPGSTNTNPADHFLVGGYLVGIRLSKYNPGTGNGTCWAGMAGDIDGCGAMNGGKNW